MPKRAIDYTLYLVTGRELLPPGKACVPLLCAIRLELTRQDYYESLEESLKGGVTLVQVREKETDTGEVGRFGKYIAIMLTAVHRNRQTDQRDL